MGELTFAKVDLWSTSEATWSCRSAAASSDTSTPGACLAEREGGKEGGRGRERARERIRERERERVEGG